MTSDSEQQLVPTNMNFDELRSFEQLATASNEHQTNVIQALANANAQTVAALTPAQVLNLLKNNLDGTSIKQASAAVSSEQAQNFETLVGNLKLPKFAMADMDKPNAPKPELQQVAAVKLPEDQSRGGRLS